MGVHLLYPDFFRFLDSLGEGADPWALYRELYLDPHREFVTAYARQVMRLDEKAWRSRVEAVRPEHYAQLREMAAREDLPAIVDEALDRCCSVTGGGEAPDVVLLVGFFSPDGFVFRVRGKLCIGIGMERWRDFELLPLFIAHEYAHCIRRGALGDADGTLAEAIAAEGVATAFSQRVYPERPLHQHLLASPGRVRWWREHVGLLWGRAMPHLQSTRSDTIYRFTAGDPESPLSRCGAYLGYTSVTAYVSSAGLEVADRRVMTASASDLLLAAPPRRTRGFGCG